MFAVERHQSHLNFAPMSLVAFGADDFDDELIGAEWSLLVRGQVHFAAAFGVVGEIAHIGALFIVWPTIETVATQIALV